MVKSNDLCLLGGTGPILGIHSLNHFVILNAGHLRRTLAAYFSYYHRRRPHLALDKQCPVERQIMKHGAIVEIAELGGLHHRYERIAA